MELNELTAFENAVRSAFAAPTCDEILAARDYAREWLDGRTRYDSSPLFAHTLGVASIVVGEVRLGRRSTLGALLHDVVRIAHAERSGEEFDVLMKELVSKFGDEVVGIALGLSEISALKLKVVSQGVADYRDMIVAYSKDPRVMLIKLADRLEVMRSLEAFPPEKRIKKSWESLNLYAQIAHKLGLYVIKSELEDLSLKYLEPAAYLDIKRKLEHSEQERRAFIAKFVLPIETTLRRLGYTFVVKSRTKSIFSIWSKMRKQNIPFEDVYDIFAIRVIVDCPPEEEKSRCWGVFSVVTDFYIPNPQRMRDWISIPKSNGYESLHATVCAPDGKWVEVQIRTRRMDEVAERGIAAHWRYKGVGASSSGSDMWLGQLRELLEQTPKSIGRSFAASPEQNEIFVFTPNGDLHKMPEGATVLDFAFDVHTEIGRSCTGGKVNGRLMSIREELHSGDIVHIMTAKSQTPKRDWLSMVTTPKAKSRIRAFLREERLKSAKLGREELERKLKNWKLHQMTIDEAVTTLCARFKFKTGANLYAAIGDQSLSLLSVKEALLGAAERREEAVSAMSAACGCDQRESLQPADEEALIIEEGLNNIEYKLGRCCNPMKGDDVFGFVTVSSGVTIHRKDCPNARRLVSSYPYRVIAAQWRKNVDGAFCVKIRVVAADNVGITASVADMVGREMKLNMRSLSFSSREGVAYGELAVEVSQRSQVDALVHRIARLKGVQKVYSVN